MTDPSNMILVAIDDNDHAWREMLTPFVTSLRRTSYDGRIGVINYGLSAEKLDVLRAQDIIIVPPAMKTSLPCDRFLSAANFVVDNEIDNAALYDADIWFQPGSLDLFSQLQDNERMYAAPDAWFCDFMSNSLTRGPNLEYLMNLGHHTVFQRFGTGIQAGLMAGTRNAWRHFRQFTNDCISRIPSDFNLIYGTDTAFVHVYAGLGNLLLLDKIYNYVPKWGVRETPNYGTNKPSTFTSNEVRIQALHMTGDIRYQPRWRYSNVYGDVMLNEGRRFLLDADKGQSPDAPILVHSADFDWAAAGLRLVNVTGDGEVVTSPELFRALFGGSKAGHAFWAIGSTRLVFEATRQIQLEISTTFPFGQPTPEKLNVSWRGHDMRLSYPGSRHLVLDEGETFQLETSSLYRSSSRMAWGVRPY